MAMQGQQPKEVPYSDLKIGQKYRVRYEAGADTFLEMTGTISMKDDKQVLVIMMNAGGKMRSEKLRFFTS